MARLSVALLSTVLLSAAGTAHAQQQQALVLVQNLEGLGVKQLVEGIQAVFNAGPSTIDWYTETLDLERFAGGDYEVTVENVLA